MKPGSYKKGHFFGIGIAIGIPLGVPLGIVMGNIAFGPAIGLPLGLVIGFLLEGILNKAPIERSAQEKKRYRNSLAILAIIGILLFVLLISFLVFVD